MEAQPELVAASDKFARLTPGYADAIMLQGFGWDSCDKSNWYDTLKSKICDMKDAGVTHIWLPPPSQSVSKQGYMPGQLYNLNTAYGSKDQLISLNKALREAGIVPLADVVINHRCADEQDETGRWNRYRDDVDHTGRRIDWGKWAITSDDPSFGGKGNPDTGADYGPAPDLDHANPDLRAALKQWMNWLKDDIGFAGWRFDFAKGFGARFIKEYVEETVGCGDDWLCVGEYWVDMIWEGSELGNNQDCPRQQIIDWINGNGKTACAFDFPTKGILQEAAKKTQYYRLRDQRGKNPGIMGWWPTKAVTFIDNHDTGSTQRHWPFPDHLVEAGNAYLLTHPGVPCMFWDHFLNGKLRDSLKKVIHARQSAGIKNDSSLEILCAESDMYVARIGQRLVFKMGPRYDMGSHLPKERDGWQFVTSGTDYAIWIKA